MQIAMLIILPSPPNLKEAQARCEIVMDCGFHIDIFEDVFIEGTLCYDLEIQHSHIPRSLKEPGLSSKGAHEQLNSVFWWLNLVRLYSLSKTLYTKRRI